MSGDLEKLFGREGALGRALSDYEARSGQLAMAGAVERALGEGRVLLCEAGTGTGKTLAYLIPALLSGKKVVVSTATRALQDQIFFKDLPLVARTLARAPRAALVKGLANYLCRRRLGEAERSEQALRPGPGRVLESIARWAAESESGDLGELVALREDDPARLAVASSSETRLGPGCAHFDQCFVTRMKRDAEAAELVVVNHHLFFADLALRGPHPGRVLPDYDAVIFDEAHRLEDIATEFFGLRISESRIERAAGDAERALSGLGGGPLFAPGARRVIEALRGAASAFFAELGAGSPGEPRITLERDDFAGRAEQRFIELDQALEALSALAITARTQLESAPGRGGALADALDATERRANQLREELAAIVDGSPGRVTWLERGARGAGLGSAPVDISWVLRERLFERVPAVVLTSATLSTRGGESERGAFAYVRSRLGLSEQRFGVEELEVGSPFDFAEQALLYTPRDLPPPSSQEFAEAAAKRVAELVGITGGGCFVLTTSLRSMRELHRRLRPLLPDHSLLVQGAAPRSALLSRFRAAGDAVLVATLGFWEGVDVPGRALRLVVLEKIPFAVPSDPVVRARAAALEAEGKSPFMDLHVPAATIVLKQGFGRLVRTERDTGIVALLDERVHRRGYGKALLAALPPARRSEDLSTVREFWQSRSSGDAGA